MRFALAFVAEGLKAGSGALVLVASQPADSILSQLRDLGVDLRRVISESRLRIIDRHSVGGDAPLGVAEDGTLVRSPLDSVGLNMALTHAIASLRGPGPRRAVVDVVSPILDTLGPEQAQVFVETAKRKFDRLQVSALFLVDKDRHRASLVSTVTAGFDGVLEIERRGRGDSTSYEIAVRSMKDTAFDAAPLVLDFARGPLHPPDIVPESSGAGAPEPRRSAPALKAGTPCPVCEAPLAADFDGCWACGVAFIARPTAVVSPDEPLAALDEPVAAPPPLRAETPVTPQEAEARLSASPKPPDRSVERGLTNGLALGARDRRVGVTNGIRGRTNGLTNGVGRTNGLTNGLGRTNGLGTSRPVPTRLRRSGVRGRVRAVGWRLGLLPLLVAATLLLAWLLVPEGGDSPYPIQIDGRFDDWAAVPRVPANSGLSGNPDIDIVQVALRDNLDFLSFFLEVRGVALRGDSSVERTLDAFYVFLDSDRSPATGYRIQGLGADRVIEVGGLGGVVERAILQRFDSTRDARDWGGWSTSTPVPAASSGNRIELEVPWDELVQPGAFIDIAFAARSWDGFESIAGTTLSSGTPFVVVDQDPSPPPSVVVTGSTVARFSLWVAGGSAQIAALNVTLAGTFAPTTFTSFSLRDDAGNLLDSAPVSGNAIRFGFSPLPVPASGVLTWSVQPDVAVADGTTVGAFLAGPGDVGAVGGGVALVRGGSGPVGFAHVGVVPAGARVDGAFAEWSNITADPIGDVPATASPDIDISGTAMQAAAADTMFFVESVGSILNGTLIPSANPTSPLVGSGSLDSDRDSVPDTADPLPTDFNNDGIPNAASSGDVDGDTIIDYGNFGGTDFWLNTTIPSTFPAPYADRVVSVFIGPTERPVDRGLDTVRFYLDQDGSVGSGHAIGGIGADFLLEVLGKGGVVLGSSGMQFSGSAPWQWSWMSLGTALAANDRSRMEASLQGVLPGIGSRAFVEASGWRNARDDSSSFGPAPGLAPATTPLQAAGDSPANGVGSPIRPLDIAGNQKWFFTNAASSATNCPTNLAASTTAGSASTSTLLSTPQSPICWYTPTKPADTFAGPWEMILDIDKTSDGTKALQPNANGDVAAWSVGSGCTGATVWDCLDEIPNDGDTSYIVSLSSSVIDTLVNVPNWGGASGTPPTPLSILDVRVDASCRRTGAPAVDVRVIVKSGGTTSIGSTVPSCANSGTYSLWSDTWTTDPSDGLPWSLADVNALQIGVRDADTQSREVRVSHVTATVTFVPVYTVAIDKCTNAPCTGFTRLYGPTNSNAYGNDVTFTTPSIPAQTFAGNERIRFVVQLNGTGSPQNHGSVTIRYNGPYPGTDDSRGTIAVPEFSDLMLPIGVSLVVVVGVRTIRERRRGRRTSRGCEDPGVARPIPDTRDVPRQ